MGAFDNFLRRRGYAKLDRYGLVLTPDERVLSTRPAVLDDGAGGKIVGWVDGDLAAMELERWGQAARPAPVKAPQMDAPRSAPMAATRPAAMAAPQPAPMAAPRLAPMAAPVVAAAPNPPVVAAAPVVEEDEWEWEIAMARARAVAEDVQSAAASMAFTRPAAPRTRPMPAVAAARRAEPVSAWPTNEEPTTQWNDATEASAPRVMSPLDKPIVVEKRSTVIPVPSLPVAARPSDVRPAPHPNARTISPRTRLARGTGREDTVQTQPIPPANDDHTSPYVTLPPEVKATGYAHTRRVAAKVR